MHRPPPSARYRRSPAAASASPGSRMWPRVRTGPRARSQERALSAEPPAASREPRARSGKLRGDSFSAYEILRVVDVPSAPIVCRLRIRAERPRAIDFSVGDIAMRGQNSGRGLLVLDPLLQRRDHVKGIGPFAT